MPSQFTDMPPDLKVVFRESSWFTSRNYWESSDCISHCNISSNRTVS